jgi:photosynthetic reaction center cytochrome c subunit
MNTKSWISSPPGPWFGIGLAAASAIVFVGAYMLIKAGWDLPPIATTQTGYRGTAMVQVNSVERLAALNAANQPPEAPQEASNDGPRVRTIYPTLQVLGDLSEEQFNRLMASFAEWVAPKEGDQAGCAYCHNVENMADRSKYTHTVAARMVTMTRSINTQWTSHVGQVGVTCYTCHRGQPVPANIWFTERGTPTAGGGMLGYRNSQNTAVAGTGWTSLPYDFADRFLKSVRQSDNIRVHSTTALPSNQEAGTMDAEKTYALMIHMSNSLGVNCVLCHNSRSFDQWGQAPPQRVTAWHGIRMVRSLNEVYLDPLQPVYPANRLGPTGDAPKAWCSTCHAGLQKPLNGAPMAREFSAELGLVVRP